MFATPESAFLAGVFFTILAGICLTEAFKAGYRYARRLQQLGVELDDYEPGVLYPRRPEGETTDLQALATTLGQLPDGMEHCTIQFRECEQGHGRLIATNWEDTGCVYCRLATTLRERDATRTSNPGPDPGP